MPPEDGKASESFTYEYALNPTTIAAAVNSIGNRSPARRAVWPGKGEDLGSDHDTSTERYRPRQTQTARNVLGGQVAARRGVGGLSFMPTLWRRTSAALGYASRAI